MVGSGPGRLRRSMTARGSRGRSALSSSRSSAVVLVVSGEGKFAGIALGFLFQQFNLLKPLQAAAQIETRSFIGLKKEPLQIAGVRLLKSLCPSSHPNLTTSKHRGSNKTSTLNHTSYYQDHAG